MTNDEIADTVGDDDRQNMSSMKTIDLRQIN